MPQHVRLTLREQPRGGEPLDVREGTESAFNNRYRRIVLVHGYNVSRREAIKSFLKFEENLSGFARHLVPDCCWVLWPGDGFIPGLRTLAYPLRLKNAKACAFEFAEYLKARRTPDDQPSEMIIIGHSLGCRLILEALAELKRQDSLQAALNLTIILMAAAVPFMLLRDDGSLHEGVSLSGRQLVLFSRHDRVLSRFFAIGQRIGRDGIDPPLEAVGERGLPSVGVWGKKYEMFYYDHGDYWSTPETARLIAGWLGAPIALPIAERMPIDKEQPVERILPSERFAPEGREVSERHVY
jgi:hypothetical protein